MSENTTIYNPNTGLPEDLKISKLISPNKNANDIMQYFYDKEAQKVIIKKIQTEQLTTQELLDLINKIKLKEMKKELEEYLEILKKGEKGLLKYFYENLFAIKGIEQTIKLDFFGDFKGLSGLSDNLDKFILSKLYKIKEFEKVVDDDSKKYTIIFDLGVLENGENYIKDFRIEDVKD